MSNQFRDVLETSCRILMRPVAKYLISSGIQYNDFVEIIKTEFIRAACDSSSAGETTSAIAERIGTSRKEVSRVRGEEEIDVATLAYRASLPASILTRWHQDPDFVNEDGVARTITTYEFESLAARVDRKIVAEDILSELVESESVEIHPDGTISPKIRYFIPRDGHSLQVLRFGMRIGDLANTMYRNSIGDQPWIEASAYNSHVAIANLPLLHSVVRTQANSLLQSLDDWLTAHSEPSSENVVRAGVGLYFFQDDSMDTSDDINTS